MCGLVGVWRWRADWPARQMDAAVQAMGDAIRHRGPDGDGLWTDPAQGVGLGHRRLAIVDLSALGAQPMVSRDGRWVLVFNGEIYNFPSIRAELVAAGTTIRSTGDTEVMLEAFARWGVLATCKRLAGMFAFALWDRQTHSLTLGRDRLGKKPLYVHAGPDGLAFASELKGLWAMPGFTAAVSPAALQEFFRFGYVGERSCVLRSVFKVQPGEIVEVRGAGDMRRSAYWSLADVAAGERRLRVQDLPAAKAELHALLQEATRSRMLTDVPLGAFLSGGIDSGLVVAMMQRAGMGTTRTFSIGFEEATHDEAPVARAVARHLGTDHTELYVTQAQALALVPALADVFDEPFADASQIPTTLLAHLARRHVTVAMTGDGGDEAFGGYLRYRNEMGATGRLYRLPAPLRHGVGAALGAVPGAAWDAAAALLPRNRRPRFLAQKVGKLARAMALDTREERAREYLSIWRPSQLLQPGVLAAEAAWPELVVPSSLSDSESMQFWETLHYLPGDLLTKMDRATMHASLEARSPLLDHRVVEFAWQLDPELKAGSRALKYLLRQLLFDHVPQALVDLPKQGFTVPLAAWMRAQLRPQIEDLLDHARRELGHLLQMPAVDAAWQAHLQGRAGQTEKVWTVAMFAQWSRRWPASLEAS